MIRKVKKIKKKVSFVIRILSFLREVVKLLREFDFLDCENSDRIKDYDRCVNVLTVCIQDEEYSCSLVDE